MRVKVACSRSRWSYRGWGSWSNDSKWNSSILWSAKFQEDYGESWYLQSFSKSLSLLSIVQFLCVFFWMKRSTLFIGERRWCVNPLAWIWLVGYNWYWLSILIVIGNYLNLFLGNIYWIKNKYYIIFPDFLYDLHFLLTHRKAEIFNFLRH